MRCLLACLILLPTLSLAEDMRLPPETARLNQMAARFAPVEVRVDLSGLPENERRALADLVKAARVIDAIFLRQVWAGNEALLLELLEDERPARACPPSRVPDRQGALVTAGRRRGGRVRACPRSRRPRITSGRGDEGRSGRMD